MKPGKNVQDFAQELQRQVASKHDFIAPAATLEFNDSHNLVVPQYGEYQPNDVFTGQMATWLGYPSSFYSQTEREYPKQWQALVNEMLKHGDALRMVRTMDGNARAYLSNRYWTLDNWDVAEAALVAMNDLAGWKFDSAELTDKKMYIKALSPKQLEVRKGDIVQAGVVIQNSEVGFGRVAVRPLILRLICLNGAIVEDMGVAKNHTTKASFSEDEGAYELFSDETKKLTDKAFLSQIADIVKAASDDAKFQLIVNKMTESTQKPIDGKVEKVVEIYAKEVKLNDGEREGILKHLITGGELTQYGLLNATTALAQEVPSYDRSVELEKIGASLLDMPVKQWKTIASAN